MTRVYHTHSQLERVASKRVCHSHTECSSSLASFLLCFVSEPEAQARRYKPPPLLNNGFYHFRPGSPEKLERFKVSDAPVSARLSQTAVNRMCFFLARAWGWLGTVSGVLWEGIGEEGLSPARLGVGVAFEARRGSRYRSQRRRREQLCSVGRRWYCVSFYFG